MPKSYRVSKQTIKELELLLKQNPHIKNYDELFDDLIKTYKANDNFYLTELYEAMKHDTFLSAEEAVQYGLADKVIENRP